MRRVLTVAILVGIFALGGLPGKAIACDAALTHAFQSRCSNALDANDWPAASVYCQQGAEQFGICADELTGNARANALVLKMDGLSLTGKAYLEMGNKNKTLEFTQSAADVAREVLSMKGIRAAFKDAARRQMRLSALVHTSINQ